MTLQGPPTPEARFRFVTVLARLVSRMGNPFVVQPINSLLSFYLTFGGCRLHGMSMGPACPPTARIDSSHFMETVWKSGTQCPGFHLPGARSRKYIFPEIYYANTSPGEKRADKAGHDTFISGAGAINGWGHPARQIKVALFSPCKSSHSTLSPHHSPLAQQTPGGISQSVCTPSDVGPRAGRPRAFRGRVRAPNGEPAGCPHTSANSSCSRPPATARRTGCGTPRRAGRAGASPPVARARWRSPTRRPRAAAP